MKTKRFAMRTLALCATVWTLAACGSPEKVSYEQIRQRYFDRLTGGEGVDLTDSVIIRQVAALDEWVADIYARMDTSAGRTYLWLEENTIDDSLPPYRPVSVTTPLAHLSNMAKAYATLGSRFHRDTTLCRHIVEGMEWMYAHKWSPDHPSYGNWWDWIIGMNISVDNTLILMYDEFTPEQRARYVAAMDYYAPGVTYEGASTGANKIWQCNSMLLRGAIAEDPAKIKMAIDGMDTEFKYVTYGDGFYTDGSYVQHEWHPYIGGYGYGLIRDLVSIMGLVSGSEWDIKPEHKDMAYDWMRHNYLPLVYQGAMMDMVRGREITRASWDDRTCGHAVLLSAYELSRTLDPARRDTLQGIVKHHALKDTWRDFVEGSRPSASLVGELRAMLRDERIKPLSPEPAHTQFPMMDRAVHARENFALGLAISSNRIEGYEAIDGENMKGWHNGDGATYLYDGDLKQHADFFWATVDPYRIPGTTVDALRPHEPSVMPFGEGVLYADGYKSPHSWVGGAWIRDLAGMAGMWFKDGSSSLEAKKSWFMLGDEIVCLGAGIGSSDNRTIETVVENRKLRGEAPASMTVDGTAVLTANGKLARRVSWVLFDNTLPSTSVGYYFPGGADVNMLRETRSGSYRDVTKYGSHEVQSRDYFTLWIDHGRNPQDATYAYVLLPGATPASLAAYAEAPSVTVLANTPQVQAVQDAAAGVTGLNFWNAGSTCGVGVDAPASVILYEKDGELTVGLADPTQLYEGTITLTLDRSVSKAVSQTRGVKVLSLSPLTLAVDVKEGMGRTFALSFAR